MFGFLLQGVECLCVVFLVSPFVVAAGIGVDDVKRSVLWFDVTPDGVRCIGDAPGEMLCFLALRRSVSEVGRARWR